MKKVINSPKAPKAIGPYSQAIEVNGMIYISGQLPVDVNTGKFAEGGIQEQTEQSFAVKDLPMGALVEIEVVAAK